MKRTRSPYSLKSQWEKRCVHARTERALEIVVVDDRHLGVFVAARRTAADVNLLHDRSVRIDGQIELGHAYQRLVIAREQEIEIPLSVGTGKRNRQRVIVRKLTRPERPHHHLHVGREGILRPHLALDHARYIRKGTEGEGRRDWAEQPRQISKRTTNARRTIMSRNHLNMSKRR